MKEVNSFDFHFKTPFPLINAVMMGLQEGKMYKSNSVDQIYVFHKAGFSYFVDLNLNNLSEIMELFIQSSVTPAYFHVYDASQGLVKYLKEQEHIFSIRTRQRLQLKLTKVITAKPTICDGFGIARIDEANFSSLSIFNLDLQTKFWRSKDDFLKNGFGFFVFNELKSPVSICYTACVVDNIAEIDIATLPGYQKKGLARLAFAAFGEHCNEKNIIANWDCFSENVSSVEMAKSLNFSLTRQYNFLSIYNKQKA